MITPLHMLRDRDDLAHIDARPYAHSTGWRSVDHWADLPDDTPMQWRYHECDQCQMVTITIPISLAAALAQWEPCPDCQGWDDSGYQAAVEMVEHVTTAVDDERPPLYWGDQQRVEVLRHG